jgi:hypothetical protein
MKRILIAALGFAFVWVLGFSIVAEPLFAHHGRGTTYDMRREVPLKGTVTELYWRNPHISIFLDVRDADGKVTNWVIEHSPIHRLAMDGYNKNTVKPGMEVTIYVNPGSGGKPIGLCQKVVLADGTEVFGRGGGNPLD